MHFSQPPFDYFGDDAANPPTIDHRSEYLSLPGLAEAQGEPTPTGSFEQHWLHTLAHVLTEEVQELYSSEKLLIDAQNLLLQGVEDKIFQAVCEVQADQAREQLRRLAQVQHTLGLQPDGRVCLTMEGLLMGLQETVAENKSGPARDARLVEIARKIKQFEVAGYCSARDFAQLLGLAAVADLLQKSLDEETSMDARLGNLGEIFNSRRTEL